MAELAPKAARLSRLQIPRLQIPLFLLATALAAAACGGVERTVTPEQLRADREVRQHVYETRREAVVSRLAEHIVAEGDRTVDILVLSGGGQHGAFGAGFLSGWAEREEAPMPEFDIVTGISAGALIAPYAFIGTAEALDRVAELYRHPEQIAPERNLVGALFRRTGGLFDPSTLSATLAEAYDASLVARMQEGFAEGRQLFVGTTDLDLGRGRVWDLAREADTTAVGVERLNKILLASTAIPGVFPPVELDGNYHTDGGITTNLLAADLQFLQALAAELRANGVTEPVDVRLWAIVNLYLTPPVMAVDVGSIQAVNTRASGLLFALNQQETLTRLWEISEAVNAGVEGLTMQLHYAAIPDAWSAEPGALALFDAAYMNRLQDYGYERALKPEPWDSLPPGPFE
jgi:hypothetical protein